MAVTWKRPRHGIAIRWVVKSETQTYLLRSAGRKCSPSNAPPIEALNRCHPPTSLALIYPYPPHPHSIGATHQLEKHPKEWLSGRMKVRHRCGREDQHRGSKQPPFNRYHLRSRWMPNHPAAGSASSKSLGKRTIRLISCLI